MKPAVRHRHIFPIVLVALTFLVGCGQTETSRLYTLSSIAEVEPMTTASDRVSVGVGPVTLPQYLDRPQIVVRQSPNRLELSEFDRWAEPLSNTVPRVVSANLAHLLDTERVYVLPQIRRRQTDFDVALDISRFEPSTTGPASLVVRWEIFTDDDGPPVDEGKIVAERGSAVAGDYEAMAASLSALLAELSEVLASRIAALRN